MNKAVHKSSVSKHALQVLEATEQTNKDQDQAKQYEKDKEEHVATIISEDKEQEMLIDVSKLYERAVEADSSDFTALADCGR